MDGYRSVLHEPIAPNSGRSGAALPRSASSSGYHARSEPCRPAARYAAEQKPMGMHMLGTILVIILILVLIGALPTWGHSRNWGYAPSGGLGLVLLIVLILVLTGNI